jgi:methylglyoxal reductase
MATLLQLKNEGKIRAIGASNATVDQLAIYRQVGPLDTDQERYSMLDRGMDATQLPDCLQHNTAFLAYSPLHHGLLTGKLTKDRQYGHGDLRNDGKRFTPENLDRTQVMLDAMLPIAEARGITLAQLTIAWTVAQPGVTHALVGARTPEQAEENAAAGTVIFRAAELATIDAAIAQHGQGIS